MWGGPNKEHIGETGQKGYTDVRLLEFHCFQDEQPHDKKPGLGFDEVFRKRSDYLHAISSKEEI